MYLFKSIELIFTMKKFLFCTLVLLCCFVSQLSAQNPLSDSLLRAAQAQAGAEKLETLRKLSYSSQNITEGVQFARLFLAEAQKQEHLEYQSLGLGKIANHYSGQFETDSFFVTFEPFEKFCIDQKYYKHYFIVVQGYVNRQIQRENYALALQKANEVYELAKTSNNDENIGVSLRNIATVYKSMSKFEEAIDFHTRSLNILRALPKPNFYMTDGYLYLAECHSNLKQNEMVLSYADSIMIAIKEAQQINPDRNYNQEHLIALCFYTSAWSNLGEPDKALNYLTQAEALIAEKGLEHNQYFIDLAAFGYYNQIGNYARALEYNQRNIDFLVNNKMTIDLGLRLKIRGELYSKTGDYKEAVNFYARAIEVNDSIDKARYARQINELRTIYELDKLELENEKTALKLRSSRMAAGMLSALALLLVAFVLVVLFNQKKLKEKNRSLYHQITEQKKTARKIGARNRCACCRRAC
jgi:tetratricopeptide (TPR) repeat protein